VITAARLRLVAPSPERIVALLAFPSVRSAVEAASFLRRALPDLHSLEFFLDSGLALVCQVTGWAPPFADRHAAYLLAEVASRHDPMTEMAEAIASTSGIEDVAVATDAPRRGQLWRFREGHTEGSTPWELRTSRCHAAVSVPGGVHRTGSRCRDPGRSRAATWLFGHAADGNVHVNVTGVGAGDLAVDERVLVFAAGMGGSISSEHGIGTAKRPWLHLNRSDAEIATFRGIKARSIPRDLEPARPLARGLTRLLVRLGRGECARRRIVALLGSGSGLIDAWS